MQPLLHHVGGHDPGVLAYFELFSFGAVLWVIQLF
jgi:hypothetical protein